MLTDVQYFSVKKGVHKIWHKSMNLSRRATEP